MQVILVRRFSALCAALGLCVAMLILGTIGGMRIANAGPQSAYSAKTSEPQTRLIGGLDLGVSYEPANRRSFEQTVPLPNAAGPFTAALQAQLEGGYRNYLDCSNQQNFARILNYYSDDLVYDSPRWKLHGKAEFEAFYLKAWKHFTEHLHDQLH